MKELKNEEIFIRIEKGPFDYEKMDGLVLMLGTGTGVAPFLSFLRQKNFLN